MVKKYRNEWKYCCSDYYFQQLIPRLEGILELDKHAENDGFYKVRSLYFDDLKDTCAMNVNAGASNRFKYRVRYYNNNLDTLHFERKEKLYGKCRKYNCKLSNNEYSKLVSGDVWDIFWDNENIDLKKFCIDVISKGFRPKLITDYERKAYVDKNLNMRVTIDKNIFVSGDVEDFIKGEYNILPLLNTNKHILEVKFDDILPQYIKELLNMRCLNQTSFSKYYVGSQKLKRV